MDTARIVIKLDSQGFQLSGGRCAASRRVTVSEEEVQMDLSQAMQALKRPADDPAHASARLVVYHNLRRISRTLRRGPSDPLMEDFVHDIFVDLLKRPHRNIRQRSRTYLRRAIDNKKIDHHRKFSREAPYVMESVGSEDHGHKIAELKDELNHFFGGVLPSLLDAPGLATAQTLLEIVTGSQTLTAAIRAEVGPDADDETLARTRGRRTRVW